MKRFFIYLIVFLISSSSSFAKIENKIIAKIGDKIITNFDIRNEINTILAISNKNINVLYGGSVNTENIKEILKITNVDGVLVGGASLKAKDFLAIYSAAVKHLEASS